MDEKRARKEFSIILYRTTHGEEKEKTESKISKMILQHDQEKIMSGEKNNLVMPPMWIRSAQMDEKTGSSAELLVLTLKIDPQREL